MAYGGLPTAALVVVCLLAVSTAEDLMINEEQADAPKPVGDLMTAKNLDLVFLIHTSPKVNNAKYKYYKEFMRDVVLGANIDTDNVRVGAVVYRKRASVLFNLKKYKTKTDLLDGINGLNLYRSKMGSVADGMDLVRTKVFIPKAGERDNAPNIVIVLTDANANHEEEKIDMAAQMLRDAGTKVYAVGVDLPDTRQLQRIASSRQDIYNLKTFVDLATVKDEVIKQVKPLQQQALPVETTASVEDVKKADIAIVYHLSNKAKPQDIDKFFVPFLKSIVEKANIDNGDVKIALVNYAKRPRTRFDLKKYSQKAQIMKELESIDKSDRAKKSNGGNALNEVRTKIFGRRGGDRPSVPNAVILITDAKTSDNPQAFQLEAQTLKDEGVKIVTVGVGGADANELRGVASDPKTEHALFANEFDNLAAPSVVEPIREAIRALQDAPAPTQPGPERATPKPEVERERETRRPEVERERATPKPEVGKEVIDRADVVFAIHFDPSRGREEFDQLISYLKSIVESSDVDGGKVRFGLYIDKLIIPFYLRQYNTNEEVMNALDRITVRNARATDFDLAGTMLEVERRMFTPRSGDRADAPNAMLIISDTSSGQDRDQIRAQSARLREAGIDVYTLGVALSDKGEMESVASSLQNIFAFADYSDLRRNGGRLKLAIPALNTKQLEAPPERKTLPDLQPILFS